MHLKTTSTFIFFILFLFISCGDNKSTCIVDADKFQNAYPYPDLQNKKDTDFIHYAIKDSLSQEDSFLYVTYGMNYLKKFNEPNLSLRFMDIETFRFIYDVWQLNISFNKNKMIIKKCTKGEISPILNTKKLDSLEAEEFRFFKRLYFKDKQIISHEWKKYYDSMTQVNPELLSIQEYKKLYDKALDYDSAKFEYDTKVIKLSSNQYCALIDSLNKTDFWKLPWKVEYPEAIQDGGGYSFEANTKDKYKLFICYGLPIDSIKMTGFCKYLLEFAGLSDKIHL